MDSRRMLLAAAGAALLSVLPSVASGARVPAPLMTISTRDGHSGTLSFAGFDKKRLTFKLKADKQDRELPLQEIASIVLAPTDSAASPGPRPDSLDIISLRDGHFLLGVFRRMDEKHTYMNLSTSDQETSELDNERIRQIAFGARILDVDRREFGKGFNLIGRDIEVALGANFASDVEQASPVVADTLVENYVSVLGKSIAAASKRQDLDYSFEVINSRVVNAFTVGGGKVFVYRGLIEQMSNEAELAGVLAHEIGHNVGKHTAKQLSDNLLMQGLVSGASALLAGGDQKRKETYQKAGGAIAYFTTLKFSRDDEREADFLATYNLYQLGYDPRAMVSMFETLRRVAGNDPSALEVFFQTHPSPAERIENTGTELPKLRNLDQLRKDSPQFDAMKTHLVSLPWPTLRHDLAAEQTRVPANGYLTYTLTLDTRVFKECMLKGHFVAAGGSGNDIRVLLFDPTNFLNWKNGHQASVMYNSGVITAADMSVPIGQPGQYFLVLDNRFSAFTEKAVSVQDFIEYKE